IRSSDYHSAKKIVPILIVALFFAAFSKFFGVIYLGEDNTKGTSVTTIFCAAINIFLNFMFITRYGISGGAFATLISFSVIAFLRYQYVKKKTSIRVSIIQSLTTILSLISICLFYFRLIKLTLLISIHILLTSLIIYQYLPQIMLFIKRKNE